MKSEYAPRFRNSYIAKLRIEININFPERITLLLLPLFKERPMICVTVADTREPSKGTKSRRDERMENRKALDSWLPVDGRSQAGAGIYVTTTHQPSRHSRKSRIMRTRKCTRVQLPWDPKMENWGGGSSTSPIHKPISFPFNIISCFNNFDFCFVSVH